MDSDEKEICRYLKSRHGQFVPRHEIARRAGGKWRFRDDPDWALPVLARLVEQHILEIDASEAYRLPGAVGTKPKKFLSPQIRAILEKSDRNFRDVLEVDEKDPLA